MATGDKLIQVKDLKKYYNRGAIKALDGVTVDIDRGDVMVVIGPSGSGKSTFLRSLNLLEEPTAASTSLIFMVPVPPYVPMLHLPERGRSIDFNRKVRLPQSASQTAPSEMGPLAKHKTLPHCQRLPP